MKANLCLVSAGIFLALVFVSPAAAQINCNTLGASVGATTTLFPASTSTKYVLYPELQSGGQFFPQFLQWSVFWGYWDDAIDRGHLTETIEYSSHGHIAGFNLAFYPSLGLKEWPLPIAILGGITHHFVSLTYLGGSDGLGNRGYDASTSLTSAEVGIRLYARTAGPLELRLELREIYPIRRGDFLDQASERRVIDAGFAYSF